MVDLKKRRPELILGILGCVAQQDGPGLFRRFPDVDLVVGPRQIGRIAQLLEGIDHRGERAIATDLSAEVSYRVVDNGYFKNRVKSPISIMEGCNNFCSYCIVPYVRGRETSRSSEEILKEARHLVSHGVKEITLLGQNVNSYRTTGREGVDFPVLLRRLNGLDGLARIRFTTSHPKDLSTELIQCFKDLDGLCPHIHLPFQAGSDRILRKMNRGYTRERYKELVYALRDARPDIAITGDVIVGFPGERGEDFLMTLELIREMEFDNLFSFKYSDRKGTPAEKMGDKLCEDEKSSRLKTLQYIQKGITLKKNRELIGKVETVLVEGESKKGNQFTGRTGTNKIINFKCNAGMIGRLVKVKIENAFVNSLQGKLWEN